MKIIKYFNKEIVKNEKIKEKQKVKEYDKVKHEMVAIEKEVEVDKPIYEIKTLEYPINDKEYEKWFSIIKKTYGKYGEITTIDNGEDIKTKEELQQEINAKLLKDSASLQIELNKQKELNANLLIKMAQLGGSTNV